VKIRPRRLDLFDEASFNVGDPNRMMQQTTRMGSSPISYDRGNLTIAEPLYAQQ